MKRGLLFLFLVFICASALAKDIHQEFQVDPGKKLSIDLRTGGTIRIEGWNKPVVSIDAFLKGVDPEYSDLKIEQDAGGVSIRTRSLEETHHHDHDLSFEIRVPNRFDAEIESMGGGITIHNVEGTFEGNTMGGKLDLSRLKGRISLSTMGGSIRLVKSHLDGEVSTHGGEVVMEEVTGNVDGSTMGGRVIQKRAANSDGKSGEVEITSMGGDLNVDDAPAGARLSTMGGDIHVRFAKDHVKAKTMGGDVRIDSVDGWVFAETMGGDVTVVMTGDAATGDRRIELVSMSGDIELTVPSNLAMTLDLGLTYTKGRSGRYSIQSDFPVSTEESEKWNESDGTPRKRIRGSGKVGDGTHVVRIRTVNGNIVLKKS